MSDATLKYVLGEERIPEAWYNLVADLPAAPAPRANRQRDCTKPLGYALRRARILASRHSSHSHLTRANNYFPAAAYRIPPAAHGSSSLPCGYLERAFSIC